MMKFLSSLFDRLMSVVVVIVFFQLPLFIEQYEMHLQGHLDESAKFVSWFQKDAESSKKTVPVYIQKFLAQEDRDFVNAGKLMQRAVKRHEELSYAAASMQAASAIKRTFVFLKVCDGEIVAETFHSFTPGLSFSFESFCYAIFGFLLWSGISFIFLRKRDKGRAV